MFDYFTNMYKYYFTIKNDTHEAHIVHNTHSLNVNKQPIKYEQEFKKNDGYKNINSNKLLDVVFYPVDI
jgi:hypothetical protein